GGSSCSGIDTAAVEAAMAARTGSYDQTVPPFSAKKVAGVKHYQLARRGEDVPEATKPVTVYEFQATSPLDGDSIEFRLSCTSGTYARTLAHEVGQSLGCGAHLARLTRESVGPFRLDAALPAALFAEPAESIPPASGWVPFDAIPPPFGEVTTDGVQGQKVSHGQPILVRGLEAAEGDWIKLLNPRREFIAVGTVVESIGGGRLGVVQPRIVFRGDTA